jgi:hypothetical protein
MSGYHSVYNRADYIPRSGYRSVYNKADYFGMGSVVDSPPSPLYSSWLLHLGGGYVS